MRAGSTYFGNELIEVSATGYAKSMFNGSKPFSQPIKATIPSPLNTAKVAEFFCFCIEETKLDKICNDFLIPSHCRKDFYILCHALAKQFNNYVNTTEDDIPSSIPEIYETLLINPSLITNMTVPITDAHYLLEIKKCPICSKPLTKVRSGIRYRNYEIVKIYPDNLSEVDKLLFNAIEDRSTTDLNSPNNNIALCIQCAHTYRIVPDEESYKRLLAEKEGAIRESRIQETLDNRDIESNIKKVIDALIDIRDESKLTKLSLNALQISEKLQGVPLTTFTSIEDKVLRFYNFIDEYLKQKEFIFTDGATIIGSEIKIMSKDLVDLGLSKSEVLNALKQEINSRIHGDADMLEACGIIVAYFVQHCEVLTI